MEPVYFSVVNLFTKRDGSLMIQFWAPPETTGRPMSNALVQLLLEHSTCCRCAAKVVRLEDHAACADGQRWSSVRLAIPTEHSRSAEAEVSRELIRQKSYQGALVRKERLKQAGNSYTRAETRALFAFQQGRCFYCYRSLRTPEGTVAAHRDHFIPLAHGGSNAIENIVLACGPCNIRKNDRDGKAFARTALGDAPPEFRAPLQAMHSARTRGIAAARRNGRALISPMEP